MIEDLFECLIRIQLDRSRKQNVVLKMNVLMQVLLKCFHRLVKRLVTSKAQVVALLPLNRRDAY